MSARASSGYIIGPWADGFFLIGAPVFALAFAYAAALDPMLMLQSLIAISPAHVFLVLYRSHGNTNVFRKFPWRFTLVPIALFAALLANAQIFAAVFFVRLLWDVHHGYMQTFGIARIYDAKAGNDPLVGRKLDMVMCGIFYLGPILSGVYLVKYVKALGAFNPVGALFASTRTVDVVDERQAMLRWLVVAACMAFAVFYVWKYRQLASQGYKVSKQKVALLACTGVVCIWAWGFNPLGMGFFTIGIFHAVQYFAIVWWSERKSVMSRLHVENYTRGPAIALIAVLVPAMTFAIVTQTVDRSSPRVMSFAYSWLCLSLMLEIMHYWYDGFIWSVRRKEVGELVSGAQPALESAPGPHVASA